MDRRAFLSSLTLLGVTRKAGRRVAGGFVNEGQVVGHQLRDGRPFARPAERRATAVAIVGGGIAGLSAGWRLQKRGLSDFVVLEMEPEAGGNARSGENDVCRYPWAAHYLPVPGPSAAHVRELCEDLGLLDHGEWRERHLCHAPQERLFIHGRWQEGLEPQVGPTRRDRDQFRRFEDRIDAFRATGAFTIPSALGRGAEELDRLSMRAWLDREGFDSPWLAWMIDYACRDDYGALARDTSAWAGIHYFSARPKEELGPLTWPEGNGWIASRLLARLSGHVFTNAVVYRVERLAAKWRVVTPTIEWTADAVIFAAPTFLASRIVERGPSTPDFEYSPWVTANLTLDRWPSERGLPPAWDNVIFDSPGLGYVVATHQLLRQYIPRTVWTYYWALVDGPAPDNRRWLLRQSYEALRDRILADLSRAHPDIAECTTRVDIMRLGHAMIRPTVGFRSSAARRAAAHGAERLYYAHSDVSGLSLFEEAQYNGVTAADAAVHALGRG